MTIVVTVEWDNSKLEHLWDDFETNTIGGFIVDVLEKQTPPPNKITVEKE